MLPVLLALTAFAGEGYWHPDQVPKLRGDLAELGIQVPAKQIADPSGPVFGATVWLGHCTGSFVSPDGLILTNAHCVRNWLQFASNDERGNLVVDGFIAPTRQDEVSAGPTARVFVPVSESDVSREVLRGIPEGADDAARWRAIQATIQRLESDCEANPGRVCRVAEEYGGREYRLVEQLELDDVRLVYAPPDTIGVFGGQVDNWMWPRHSGDFAFVRAYAGPDSAPYRPAQVLTMSAAGASPGDAVMLPGYPARTMRYQTTTESKHAALVRYPGDIELFSGIIEVMDAWAEESRLSAARMGVHRFFLANQLKNAEGMRDNFGRGSLATLRSRDEARLAAWIQEKKKRADSFGPDLDELQRLVSTRLAQERRDRLVGLTSYMPQLLAATRASYRLAVEREKPPGEQLQGFQERDVKRIKAQLVRMQTAMHPGTERDVFAVIIRHMRELPDGQRAAPFDAWFEAAGGPAAGLEKLFDKPRWLQLEDRLSLLTLTREQFEASDDPWISLAVRVEQWRDSLRDQDNAYNGAMTRLRPRYIEAFNAARGGRAYADANGTARISFGRVEGYTPRDAVIYLPQTTVRGMADRHGPPPFDLPGDLLLAARSSGPNDPRADAALGGVPVCFLASAENTGGNSGSPVLNARGQVVGVAFDRNYEGMAADWLFEPDRTRSIQVDTRFMLWMLDRTAGADGLVKELGLSATTAAR